MGVQPEVSGEFGSRLGPGSRLTTLALIPGVAGGLCRFGADLLRRAAFTGLGAPGALDYSLINGVGLLGTSMGVGITGLCAVLLWGQSPESEIRYGP